MAYTEYAPTHAAGTLTRRQKAVLAQLAREAWVERGCPAEGADAWRRAQSLDACGVRISQAGQRHFAALKARFLDLAGRSGDALNTLVRDEDNARRIAHHKLADACRHSGLPLSYPAAICRRQYRCALVDATAPQLWRLVFTIRNRARVRKPSTRP